MSQNHIAGSPALKPVLISFPPIQDRVLINRIDLVCQAVLSGKWPSSRRSQEMVTGGILGPGNHLLDSPSLTPGEYGDSPVPTPRSSSAASMAEEEVSAVTTAAAQFTKLRRGMDEKEFTVQIKDVSLAFRHWEVGNEAVVLLTTSLT